MSILIGHAATVLGEYMYVMGGNDLSDTFGDLWRISLEIVLNYAAIQWKMASKTEMEIEIERNRNRENVRCANSDEYDKNNVGKISRKGSSDVCVVPFTYPVWEILCKNCSSVGRWVHKMLLLIY